MLLRLNVLENEILASCPADDVACKSIDYRKSLPPNKDPVKPRHRLTARPVLLRSFEGPFLISRQNLGKTNCVPGRERKIPFDVSRNPGFQASLRTKLFHYGPTLPFRLLRHFLSSCFPSFVSHFFGPKIHIGYLSKKNRTRSRRAEIEAPTLDPLQI